MRHWNGGERLHGSYAKGSQEAISQDTWTGAGAWRIIHRILGALVLTLGLINVSLGVFLAVLPLPVWVTWYVYMSILVIVLVALEIMALIGRGNTSKGGLSKSKGKKINIENVSL